MSRIIFLALFSISSCVDSFGQSSKFDTLVDELYFNIFKGKPDTSIFPFLKKYFPVLTKEHNKPEGGWTMYPPGPPPKFFFTVHSFIFSKHPYFNTKFRQGQIDFTCSELKEGAAGIHDVKLWFVFDSKNDAFDAFEKLCNMFDPLSKTRDVQRNEERVTAKYSTETDFQSYNSVIIVLAKDELHDGRFKLLFKTPNYTD
jgi:hypothetical protein